MTLAALRARARNNTLEVEHILGAARKRLPGLRAELQRLAAEYGWSDTPYPPDGTHVVPYAKWAEIAGAYAEDGIAGLAVLTQQTANWPYITGLLEELQSLEAVEMLMTMQADSRLDAKTAAALASAYNHLLSFRNPPSLSEAQQASIRDFLTAALKSSEDAAARMAFVCALRGVGDESTLALLESLDDLVDVRPVAIRAIRKRLKDNAK